MLFIAVFLLAVSRCVLAAQARSSLSALHGADPLQNVRLLADCLYNHNDLGDDCIPTYCQPSVTVHVRFVS
jgi:hypothetical protein